jgi:hypothetical protein
MTFLKTFASKSRFAPTYDKSLFRFKNFVIRNKLLNEHDTKALRRKIGFNFISSIFSFALLGTPIYWIYNNTLSQSFAFLFIYPFFTFPFLRWTGKKEDQRDYEILDKYVEGENLKKLEMFAASSYVPTFHIRIIYDYIEEKKNRK